MKTSAQTKSKATSGFDLEDFLPYLLNQAAEATSRSFQAIYAEKYGMTRTQWRVLANLGKFGSMTAKDICRISHIEKTKVSRAIAALEEAGFLRREVKPDDKRAEHLHLTRQGMEAFRKLGESATRYDTRLRQELGLEASNNLVTALKSMIKKRSL